MNSVATWLVAACAKRRASASKTLETQAQAAPKREKSAITLQINTVETFLVANYGHRCSASQTERRKDA